MSSIEKRVFTILVFIFGASFMVLSLMVTTNYTMEIDLKVTNWFYNIRGEYNGIIYFILRFLTELGYIYILVPLILIFSIKWRFDNRSFCFGFGCLLIYLSNELIKLLFRRSRPNETMQWMTESSTSFPSGHAMTSLFAYGIILYFLLHSGYAKKIKVIGSICMCSIILIIGITRLGLGVHYLSDIIGGYFLGFIGLAVILFLYDYLYSIGFDFIYSRFKKQKGNIKREYKKKNKNQNK